jgi:multidrug efflux pump subunit AcrA (membrane-fusion protein)
MSFEQFALLQHQYMGRINKVSFLENDVRKKNRLLARASHLREGVEKYEGLLAALQQSWPVYADKFVIYPKRDDG